MDATKSLLLLALAGAIFGQERHPPLPRACPDFLERIQALLSEDPKIREAVSDPGEPASDCLAMLLPKNKQYLDREILPLVARGLASQDEQVRVHASAIPAFLTMFRDDSAEVLESFVPLMFDRFYDQHRKIRQNALISVAGLRPGPPPVATEHLIRYLEARQGEAAPTDFRDKAFSGLARIVPMTDRISELLEREVARTHDAIGKGNLLMMLGEVRKPHRRILSLLIGALAATEPYVVEKAVEAVMQLGPQAAEAAPALRRLAAEKRLGEQIASLAARAADRVEGKQKE